MEKNLQSSELGRRLLASGLPMSEVRRYMAELRDHRQDLVDEGIATGLSRVDAQTAADTRLGRPAQVARAVIKRFRRATFIGRHPLAFFVLLPFFGSFLAWLGVTLIIGLVGPGLLRCPAPVSDATRAVAPALGIVLTFAIPCLLTGWFYHAAKRRALALLWRAAPAAYFACMAIWIRLDIGVDPLGPHGRISLGADPDGHFFFGLIPLVTTMALPFLWRTGRRSFTHTPQMP